MKACNECKHWTRDGTGYFGSCNNPKFVYKDELAIQLPIDGLIYLDAKGYSASFETGQNFGCIHFQCAACAIGNAGRCVCENDE